MGENIERYSSCCELPAAMDSRGHFDQTERQTLFRLRYGLPLLIWRNRRKTFADQCALRSPMGGRVLGESPGEARLFFASAQDNF